MKTETFSFTLRAAESYTDLLLACQVRAEAYGHKVPEYRESMAKPDAVDASPSTTVFLCEDKVSGRPVGTMRIQACTRSSDLLEIERHVDIPNLIASSSRGEITRLASPIGADPFVRLALWKAGYLFCQTNHIRWLVMGVRKPALIKAYERMGAKDIFADKHAVPLAYAANLPHRIFALDIENCYSHWKEESHPLLEFMTQTRHADIKSMPMSMNRTLPEKVRLHVLQ